MQLTIEWKEFPPDVGIIWRRNGDSFDWSAEENRILYEIYPTDPPEAIQQALPHRTWKGIMSRASELRIRRLKKPGGVLYPQMSVEDLQIAERYGVPLENLGVPLFTQWVYLFHALMENQGWYPAL